MANVKISELSESDPLDGTEMVPIVQDGITVRTTAQEIADLSAGTITGAANVGGGAGVFKDVTGGTLNFKSLINSDGFLAIDGSDPNEIDIRLATVVPISFGGTGQSNAQAALNNLTNIGAATDGDYLQYLGGNAQFAPLTLTAQAINDALGLTTNTFLFTDASNDIVGYSQWSVDPVTKSADVQTSYQPNNLSVNKTMFNWNVNIDPLQNSPNDTVFVHNISANLDAGLSGFSLGTAGQAVTLVNGGFNFQGSATYGRLILVNLNNGFGNGTDPLTFMGHSGMFLGFSTQPNVTIDGSCSGYAYNLALDPATVTTPNFAISVFTDFSQLGSIDVYGYQGLVLQPNIGTIKNNSNFNGFFVNPTIENFEGNAGFQGGYIGGTITNQSASNGYQGFTINPNIVHLTQNSQLLNISGQTTDGTAEWTSINISTSQVNTTGTVRALQINTDPGHSAIESTGHSNLQVGFELVSSLGQQYGHVIGGGIIIPDGTAITGTDVLANNMAFSVDTGDSGSSWTAASVVGLTTLGFVGQIIGEGTINGAINFCLNGYAAAHTGHIDQVNNFFAAAIPAGAGTMDVSILFYGDRPAGSVADDEWGLRIDDSSNTGMHNFLVRLALNTADKKTTNDSVALEIGGNTAVFLNARLTTAEGDALTKVGGMQFFDTDLNQMKYWDGSAWVIY